MYKGIVMSKDSEYAYIFTENCRLVKVALAPEHQIGMEISLDAGQAAVLEENTEGESAKVSGWKVPSEKRIFENIGSSGSKIRIFKTSALAASLLLFVLAAFFAFQAIRPASVYATVSVDINPSINLEIDRNLIVLDAIALDQETSDLLSEIELKQLPLQDAIAEWVNYLTVEKNIESEDILIAGVINRTETNLSEKLTLMENELPARFKSEEQIRVRVIFSYDDQLGERAAKNNLSIGRQMIYENALGSEFEFNLSNAARNRIGQMIDDFVENGGHDWTKRKNSSTPDPDITASLTDSNESVTAPSGSSGESANKVTEANSNGSQTKEGTQGSQSAPQGTTERHTQQNQPQPADSKATTSPRPTDNFTENTEDMSDDSSNAASTTETVFSRSLSGRQTAE
jgi:hypothetical protein